MKFTLKIRIFDKHDLCLENPFLPDYDDYDMYLNALREDISNTSGILEVVLDGSDFYIDTTNSTDVEELKKIIKPLFTESIMRNLRFDSLTAD